MKRISYVCVFVFLFISVFTNFVFADEPTDIITNSGGLSPLQESLIEKENEGLNLNAEFTVQAKASPVTPSTSNGFHSVIISLLGNYEPITVDYEYRQGSNTYVSHNITTDPDWSWIASAVIFALVLYCVFRFIGGLLCKQ